MTDNYKSYSISIIGKKIKRKFELAKENTLANRIMLIAISVIGLMGFIIGMTYADNSALFIIVGILGMPLMSIPVIKLIISE